MGTAAHWGFISKANQIHLHEHFYFVMFALGYMANFDYALHKVNKTTGQASAMFKSPCMHAYIIILGRVYKAIYYSM